MNDTDEQKERKHVSEDATRESVPRRRYHEMYNWSSIVVCESACNER